MVKKGFQYRLYVTDVMKMAQLISIDWLRFSNFNHNGISRNMDLYFSSVCNSKIFAEQKQEISGTSSW